MRFFRSGKVLHVRKGKLETLMSKGGDQLMELLAFDEVYNLMEAAFPDTEIRTREGQHALLAHPNYRIDVDRDAWLFG